MNRSRRTFLAGAGAAVSSGLLAPSAAAAQTPSSGGQCRVNGEVRQSSSGYPKDKQVWLKAGDRVTTIEGLGELEFRLT